MKNPTCSCHDSFWVTSQRNSDPKMKYSPFSLLTSTLLQIFSFFYVIFQNLLYVIFAPSPPPPASVADNAPKKRIAIIGTGLTGVSSAAHCVGHGFDVQLFESRSKDEGLGGIWSVCPSRGLQLIHKVLIRSESKFHLFAPSTQHHVPIPSVCAV